MSQYRIEFRPGAARSLRTLEPGARRRVQGAIALLAQDLRPKTAGARVLKGKSGLRVRLGDYRIIYAEKDNALLVVVVRLGHRRGRV